ncbi:unnamed protein product [Cuscuta campestris]|uniref:Uncharacterized protein n=1 Tax=Cuscuta campestris TaxID=132261 RepID=A0A484LXY9_9ASTE|nr:unnamed protein product [Cuscuta campestris]
MHDVLPGTSNCPDIVYFYSRANTRGFLTSLPPRHKKWKKRFVFIEFPTDQFPFSNLEWADRVIKPERVHPEPTPELEDACEKLLKGDPVTGKPYAYGGWVYRLSNPDGGVSATHDAEDDRVNTPGSHAEARSPHPDMNITRMSTLVESDDDDVEVLHANQSPSNLPSPPHICETEGATSARGNKKKKIGLSDLEGESIEETFLALAKKHSKAGVISEEISQSLLEPKDQVFQLTLLLDSAKLEIMTGLKGRGGLRKT